MNLNDVVVFVKKVVIRVTIIAAFLSILYLYQQHNVASYLSRDWVVLIHVIGAIVFLGNIIVSAAWMFNAGRTEQLPVINFASNNINRSDMYFIQPGVFVLAISGVLLAGDLGHIYNIGWLTVGIALFSLSGVVWGLFLRKYQNQMVSITKKCLEQDDDTASVELPEELYSVLKRWYSWGVVAMLLVIASLGFMSLKPNLW